VADAIVRLCLPAFDKTGRLFDVPSARFLEFRRPE
jgi:hypothetical protein